MKITEKVLGTCLIALLLLSSCTKESSLTSTQDLAPAPYLASSGGLASGNAMDVQAFINQAAMAKTNASLAIWGDCEGFRTVGTPTSFKPTAGNFDELYNGAHFMDGLGAVSESKPGDKDFNGGRWHVNTLKEGVDPDKYMDVCSVEDIDPNDFESTDVYFECPMRPARGKGFVD